MSKENRSDWVAVEPQFAAASTDIPKARTAFQFFQKERADELKAAVRAQNNGQFAVALLAKTTHAAWNALDQDERAYFDDLAAQDQMRYRAASHAADVAALERKERLRAEREAIILDDDDDYDDNDDQMIGGQRQRTTRGAYEKKQKRAAKREKRQQEKRAKKGSDDDDDDDDDDYNDDNNNKNEGSDNWNSDDDDDSDDDSNAPKKKKAKKPPRPVSQKQLEYQARKRAEKEQKEAYIQQRQQDLRKSKADQAKRRLEFLLQQSDIFSHFGRVKEDTAKYGIQTNHYQHQNQQTSSNTQKGGSRRNAAGGGAGADNNDDAQDLADADEHEATFLTTQPTTLGFGKMRAYQLEGLNWMIRLQENGVNGILADEVSVFFLLFKFDDGLLGRH